MPQLLFINPTCVYSTVKSAQLSALACLHAGCLLIVYNSK